MESAKRLVKFLLESGMTIAAVSKGTTIPRSSLDAWITGKRDLTNANQIRLNRWIYEYSTKYITLIREWQDDGKQNQ